MALLTYSQQQAIKPISPNNERRYAQLEKDVEDIQLPRLLGFKLAQMVQDDPDGYADLLNGSTFDYCGYTIKHKGLRYCLAYFIYAEYVNQSGFEDTFTGMVRQNRTETDHATGGQLKQIAQTSLNAAETAFLLVKKYIEFAELNEYDRPTHKPKTSHFYNI